MIKTDVPAKEADALTAKGKGRVLERVTVPGKGVYCTVETHDAEPAAGAEEPKRKGRPPKSASKG